MQICTICNNDTFIYKNIDDETIAICTVCGGNFYDDDDDYEEDEE